MTTYFDECPDFAYRVDEYASGADETAPLWSSLKPPPEIGDRINVRVNWIGTCTVLRYFVEHGYLGILALPDKCPEWMREQNGTTKVHLFGIDLDYERAEEGSKS
jgi:hypothetical protein